MSGLGLGQLAAHGFAKLTGAQRAAGATSPVAAALGLDKPWHTSPGDLWDWAVQQPGARAVPDDELRIAWSA